MSFEHEIVVLVEECFNALPPDSAKLEIGQVPGSVHPTFKVVPRSVRAAQFGGFAVGRELNLDLGSGQMVEFWNFALGGTLKRGLEWREEFRLIWHAIVAGGYTEDRYYWGDRLIRLRTEIDVAGEKLVFGSGPSWVPKAMLRRASFEFGAYDDVGKNR